MGILLLLVGLLTLGSGAIKLRGRSRQTAPGVALLTSEMVVGGLVLLGSGSGLARIRPAAWAAVVVALATVVASLVAQLQRVQDQRRRREASEAGRLERYLRGR